jgi:plastocyanin
MNRRLALLLSCLALCLVVAGCGGGDDEQDAGNAPTTGETPAQEGADKTTGAGGAAAGGPVTVSMKNTRYLPMEVRVKVGDTVKWTNDDPFPHTVTKSSGPGPKFDSGTVDGGETYEQKFTKAGKVDYVCTIHPRQVGTVRVD